MDAEATLRDAMSRFPTGVSIVTTRDGEGVLYGTTANALTSVPSPRRLSTLQTMSQKDIPLMRY